MGDYNGRCAFCYKLFQSPRGLAIHYGMKHRGQVKPGDPAVDINPQAPRQQPGTVEMVAVEWIMQHAKGSCDGYGRTSGGGYMAYDLQSTTVDYVAMMREKATDDHFGDIIGAILQFGFRVPIVLALRPDGGFNHGNGHHRMCAAILLGLESIPVYWSASYHDWMCEPYSDTEDLGDYPEWEDLNSELSYELDDTYDPVSNINMDELDAYVKAFG